MNEVIKEPGKEKKKISWKKIALIGGICLLAGITAFIIYRVYFTDEKNSTTSAVKKSNKVANALDGTKVDPDRANRHPLAIMVENHTQSRPQTGLDKASIVYEAITEGGITRFMAVYGPNDADKVGPVRSARTYFVDWVAEFKAFYGHCGGNLDALDKIKQDGILDLDQFAVGDKAYWREPQKGKATEHTMFTSTQKLYAVAKEKNWQATGDFTSLKFGTPDSNTTTTSANQGQKITINFSAPEYLVNWDFDSTTSSYLRSLAGKAHNDAITNQQLKAVNVIIQEVNREQTTTSINESGYKMDTIGSGKARIFSAGKEYDGTWKKVDQTSRTKYYDAQGGEITFTPGVFWIEIVPPDIYSIIKVETNTAPTTKTP